MRPTQPPTYFGDSSLLTFLELLPPDEDSLPYSIDEIIEKVIPHACQKFHHTPNLQSNTRPRLLDPVSFLKTIAREYYTLSQVTF